MGRYGMAGNFYRRSGYVTLQDVPDPNREYVESFDNLVGGMNRFDLDYALKGNESPFMQNMSWHNGTLTSRLGQVVKKKLNYEPFLFMSSAPFLFHGWWFIQIPDSLCAVKLKITGDTAHEQPLYTSFKYLFGQEFPRVPGLFFLYRDAVYFKAKGGFYRLTWQPGTGHDSENFEFEIIADASSVSGSGANAFVPTVQMNSNPATGAGDPFQQENRLTYKKKITYNGDGSTQTYHLPAPYIGATGLTAKVNGVTKTVSFQPTDGTFVFDSADIPSVGQNNVEVEFQKSDSNSREALESVLYAEAAITFGGAQDLCIVMGNTPAQPNAYFWSGNNGIVMDPTYFPMNQYNLAGDNDDPITVFGKQQNMLVIFQRNAVGRAVFGTEKISDLETVTMNYTRINAEIGCDLPGSLQLVENNLVWCNRRYGVCRLKDSSAAYENNITILSRKINGDYRIDGLLKELNDVNDDQVRSVDTGKRYILVLGDVSENKGGLGRAYEWNYELSEYGNPSWFYHTGIYGVAFIPLENDTLYEVTLDGEVCKFEPVFKDFEESAIEKIYRFPPRDFGGYDRLKNIKSILVTTRSDAPTNTVLKYVCDYKERTDPTNLVVSPNERNFAVVFRRKPGFHNMHHLGIEMSNNTAGEDLNLLSAKIFYEYRGRQR